MKAKFNNHSFPRSQIDGKLLCWLCTLSYKRAVAKARQEQTHAPGMTSKKRPSTDKQAQMKENHKKMRLDSSKQALPEIPDKIVRNSGMSMDPNSSDHMVAMTQLKEQIASLQKRLTQKDREMLAKDKHITELKGQNFQSENELRTKLKDQEKLYENKVDVLNKKLAGLLQEVAKLSKAKGKVTASSVATIAANSTATKDSGGSGTDSPNGQWGNVHSPTEFHLL